MKLALNNCSLSDSSRLQVPRTLSVRRVWVFSISENEDLGVVHSDVNFCSSTSSAVTVDLT